MIQKKKASLAAALLDAQVIYLTQELTGDGLERLIEQEVDAALEVAGRLKLHDIASRAATKRTVRRLLTELAPGDSLAGLTVDLALALHGCQASDRTRMDELVEEGLVERIVDQALSMAALREALIRGLIASPAYASFASDLLYQGIRGYLASNTVTRSIPGAQSMMKLGRAALNKATPGLEAALEDGIKKYISQAVKATSEHSVELLLSREATRDLRRTALELWGRVGARFIGGFRREVPADDARRGATLAHELVNRVRGSSYAAALADTVVDAIFDRYEDKPLTVLFEETGLTRQLLNEEILRHAAPALKHLHRRKALEPMLRRRLQGFYESEAASALLGGEI